MASQVRQPSTTLPLPLLLLLAVCCPRRATTFLQQCQNQQPTQQGPCQNVSTVPDCGQLYSLSFFPNNITDSLQSALLHYTSYEPVYRNCSDYLRAHLCLALLPACSDTGPDRSVFKPPCRNLCSKVRSDCGDQVQVIRDPRCLLSECDRYPDTDCVGMDDPIVVATLPTVAPSERPSGNRSNVSTPTNATESTCPPPSLVTPSERPGSNRSNVSAPTNVTEINATESTCPHHALLTLPALLTLLALLTLPAAV